MHCALWAQEPRGLPSPSRPSCICLTSCAIAWEPATLDAVLVVEVGPGLAHMPACWPWHLARGPQTLLLGGASGARGTGRRPCWAPCVQKWLRVQSSILRALGCGRCWLLPPGVRGSHEGPAGVPPESPGLPCTARGCSGPLLPRHALWPGTHPEKNGLAALVQLSPFCLLATASSESLLRGFYPFFFTKFLFFF